MFKFLKEMVDAVKEGVAEAAAESKQEAGEAAAIKEKADKELVADFERLLATTSQPERMAAALAAPYRETFLSEFSTAADTRRPPLFLFSASLPEKEVEEWKSLLNRDFDIDDAEGAQVIMTALLADLKPDTDPGEVAVSIVRAAHIVTGAAGVGYIGIGQALEWAEPLAQMAASRFDSRSAYGQAFLAGEAKAAGSNFLGRKFLAGAVKRLQDDPASPWKSVAWPQPAVQS
jgi:hypothetical protein